MTSAVTYDVNQYWGLSPENQTAVATISAVASDIVAALRECNYTFVAEAVQKRLQARVNAIMEVA